MKQKIILESNKLLNRNFEILKNKLDSSNFLVSNKNNIQKKSKKKKIHLNSFTTLNSINIKKFKLNSFDIPIFSRISNKLCLNSLDFVFSKNKRIINKSKKFRLGFFKRNFVFKINADKSLIFKNKFYKSLYRYKRFKKRLSSLNSYKFLLNKAFLHKIVIRVTGNNFFCTLIDLEKKKIKLSKSAKQFKLKTSKKRISFNLPIVLYRFRKLLFKKKLITLTSKIKKVMKRNKKKADYMPSNLIIKVIAKKRIRRKIIRFFFPRKLFRQKRMFILDPKKCFNGCRAVKARRKKRLRFRIFK